MIKHYMQDMSWNEFRDRLTKCDNTVIIPIGSTEQHGPYPLWVDCYNATSPLKRLTQLTDNVIIAPLIPFGYSAYHAEFPGTITLKFETSILLYEEVCESLIRAGTKKIIWVEGHEGCSDAAAVVSKKLREKYGLLFVSLNFWSMLADVKNPTAAPEVLQVTEGHGGLREGSICLASVSEELRQDIRKQMVNFTTTTMKIPWAPDNFVTPKWSGPHRSLQAKLTTSKVNGEALSVTFPGGNFQDFTPYGHVTADMKAHSVEFGQYIIELMAQHLVKILEAIKQIDVPIAAHPHQM